MTGAPRVEVLRAEAAQEPVLANLLELYAHDFSEFIELRLQAGEAFGARTERCTFGDRCEVQHALHPGDPCGVQ